MQDTSPALPMNKSRSQDQTRGEKAKVIAMRVVHSPSMHILIGACVGLLIGLPISEGRAPKELASWISIPGILFIRGLQCIMVPLVFIQIVLATLEMVSVDKAFTIGRRTFLLYVATTVLASIQGVCWACVFVSSFQHKGEGDNSDTLKAAAAHVMGNITLSETLQQGIILHLVPGNFVQTFAATHDSVPNFGGVIVVAIALSCAYAHMQHTHRRGHALDVLDVLPCLKQVHALFTIVLTWWVTIMPFAICSLIASAVAQRDDLSEGWSNVKFVIASAMCAWCTHVFVLYVVLYVVCVRRAPWQYVRHLFPALAVAMSTASPTATLPVIIRCVKESKMVPPTIRNFVLTVGATINMDGAATYVPTVLTFLAVNNGLREHLTVMKYVCMALVSIVGYVGTAQIPHASLVFMLTAYNTLFTPLGTTHHGFEYIVAIEWFMGRMRTVVNVIGDAVVTICVGAMENDGFRLADDGAMDDFDGSKTFDSEM
eukprot:GEMP01026454.1.p1 GENE.GEMP01026454.1~~GEMP01026454.1.p1  ORF type:complete len:486 (-),score=145.79 GEMP01026454.1:23-1480(-)